MKNGKIGVTTENIFPVIKKFLYSDHEIFLRELISNAVDATQKLKTLSSIGEMKGELGDLTIHVAVDKEAKTLTVTDRGVGMTAEEVDKYINQIAFSGAEEFMEKYKNQSIIGHFGLGFYSSFMVADKVEIFTKSYKKEAKTVHWSCTGTPEFEMEETDAEHDRGTTIVLHLSEDSLEYAESSKVEELLRKYCRFLPVPIAFGKVKEWKDGKYVDTDKDNIINNVDPLWTRKPADITEEQYKEFYHELYPLSDEPLFSIHLNIDYPFHLTGILYFPKIHNNFEIQKNKIQLYSNQVYEKARAKASGTELPTPPEAGIDAKLEMLMTECDGHAETEDAEILHARRRFEELCEEFTPEVKREAEVVRNAGGLFIIGTERHESRRIDNQLRGRAGRQGDPGASRFFLSLEDDLMRIFGGDRVQSLMDSLGLDEDVPIENKLITNTIESAQKKLEASNFAIRKQVLQYDDVMNQQREIIYKQRQMVLDGEDISGKLHEMMRQAIDDACTNYLNGETADDWDFAGLRRHFMNWLCLPTDFNYTTEQLGDLTKEGIADELYKRGMDILTAKEKRYGAKTMRELERICLLRNVDSKWMEHIDNMDQLKQGMGLRGYGQHDPVVEYRIEGFAMFDEMIASIREDAVHMLLTIEIRQQNAEPKREQIAKPTGDNAPGDTGAKAPAPVRVTKIGRNDPCPCGSGLKWKKCTCKEYHPDL